VGVNSVHWAQELLKVTFNSILACDFIIIIIYITKNDFKWLSNWLSEIIEVDMRNYSQLRFRTGVGYVSFNVVIDRK